MANPQAFQGAWASQNKGTLVAGQSITVNKYNVQVERYLSQGGFAHVYLVRTATPVYNTTHHVLKRIAVANEGMLSEVKKEVDIMRLLKGHPNIVHLIDAAWHRMPNGLYEVFILMEFCPGGGIIDMMNRRLRERLTEAEILQIFVDVCEGVAFMHNLRPALLHRDLKVENILQAGPTSFKLCDFGSATAVAPKPPASVQEIRALEADLNRHTTLQYRAPEMVDPYLRRPVDEKSDVWALGVLLYKLCYYTTPFEEHGQLAILNVQYRIPPYPSYSSNMNALIASMLREHGTQRPTVFELLNQVHLLRGTKSQFQYTIPVPPPLSPRHLKSSYNLQDVKPPNRSGQITSNSDISRTGSPAKNAGIQARDKVLEAIEPMRRGRPNQFPSSPSPQKKPKDLPSSSSEKKNWFDGGFDAEDDKAWKAVTQKVSSPGKPGGVSDDAWIAGTAGSTSTNPKKKDGFGDDFGEKLWDSFDPTARSNAELLPSSNASIKATTGSSSSPLALNRKSSLNFRKEKDAFDGLGLVSPNSKPAPTLGEARKLRTGLAISGYTSTKDSERPKPSPSPTFLPQSYTQSLSPMPPIRPATSGSSWSSQAPGSKSDSPLPTEGLPAEARYPSLEQLDATFGSTNAIALGTTSSRSLPSGTQVRPPEKPAGLDPSRNGKSSLRSTHDEPSRPSLIRKHRSSMAIKHPSYTSSDSTPSQSPSSPVASSRLPKPSQRSKDWLTGDDSDAQSSTPSSSRPVEPEVPKLRDSPSKRASYIEKSPAPLKASLVMPDPIPSPTPASSVQPASPSVERFTRAFPALDPAPSWSSGNSRFPSKEKEPESASSADEGPEEAGAYLPKVSKSKSADPQKSRHKGRQSSVHDLVDLYGGRLSSPAKEMEKEMPAVRSTITPILHKSSGTDSNHKRRSTGLSLTSPSKSNPVPSSMLSLPASTSTPRTKQPSPTRSRPQSLFMFPSQSPEPSSSPVTSPGLAPPPEGSRTRNVRRTSISDMVQRYEAIGSSIKSPSAVKPPIQSPLENGRSGSVPAPPKVSQSRSALPVPGDSSGNTSKNLPRMSPLGSSMSSPLPEPDNVKDLTPRPRRTSVRPDGIPLRKSATEEPSHSGERSPSPDRPYQGVGKLIDQWQKKSTETDSSRNVPRRGGFVAKRAGLVNGGSHQ